MRYWTSGETKVLRELVKRGVPISEMSEVFTDRTEDAIRRRIRRLKLPYKPQSIINEERLAELYQAYPITSNQELVKDKEL